MESIISIKLRSYEAGLVDKSASKIQKAVEGVGATISGPIPLPTRKESFTLLRSPHVDKKSKDKFRLETHSRLIRIRILNKPTKVIDALSKIDLPSGVYVEIKA
ncbi:MAG: 30S ribosomal protein S10 [Solitalea-like symbiont of Acarus siro]